MDADLRNSAASVSPLPMPTAAPVRALWLDMVSGFFKHDLLTQSAALAFFFLMSMFPFLIFVGSGLALLPIHHLVERLVDLVSNFAPNQSLPFVEKVLSSTMRNSKGLLSMGFAGAIIFASTGFAAMIAALDTAYEVAETRSFWRLRLRAIWITLVVGSLICVASAVVLLGPRFSLILADAFDVSDGFVAVWPYMRWIIVLGCMLSSILMLYYFGPNVRHSVKSQLPGALLAVVLWVGSSVGLGIYIRSFKYFTSTYGALAVFIVLMLRFQLSALAILIGAELNAQIGKRRLAKELLRIPPPAATSADERESSVAQSTQA